MRYPSELKKSELEQIVTTIRDALWPTDRAKPTKASAEVAAYVLSEYGLAPGGGSDLGIPRTIQDFQIYGDYPRSVVAANDLHKAMKKGIKAVQRQIDPGMPKDEVEEILWDIDQKIMAPVRGKYSREGASDTEPLGVMRGRIYDEAEAIVGYKIP